MAPHFGTDRQLADIVQSNNAPGLAGTAGAFTVLLADANKLLARQAP